MERANALTEIEVRVATLDGGRQEFDEVIASNASVHLEKMGDSLFALIVETTHERACFHIFSKNGQAHLDARTSWHDPRNGHSEGQKRRWNRASAEQRKAHGKRVWRERRSGKVAK